MSTRAVSATLPAGTGVTLDNGQHILIGAYRNTLRLMRLMGVAPAESLLDQTVTLQFVDGSGICFSVVSDAANWRVDGRQFDAIVLVGSAENMAQTPMDNTPEDPLLIAKIHTLAAAALALRFEAISSV